MTALPDGGDGPLMHLDVITVFPEYLAPLQLALIGRAADRGIVDVAVHDLRGWTHDVHKSVDDTPFGGGPGMVMRPTVWGGSDRPPARSSPSPAAARGRPALRPTPSGA